ncbi:methylated-DNA--[protein]-cysteine S-methyltransferase [Xanthomonas graminis]|jgi:methylated-DNA-[protein]-cysteine S-methyltransferase|uniref:Methylated-DNA--protein-cysteine methyltransferase n=1 Tax=Xanthomonas graminis pv. graminis TaxID=134874 RepID=A0A1M4JHD1_9XANT|nr:methylated-DNA--[protein]-cysteine S-methyltransferase [Xanthomonas translucens]OAX62829.1 cysteine methyltransferase [Xanthomonas translucens pv. graminis]UKE53225.1 methylated-DNA--[protein]-cysteine S-methyltransferase [Xanthomonas translucens pv. graminis]WIH07544.1 methylated-DNA--[protein]-cysteine S-methyltransferase [Xanthomonas translucens pv. graminis]WIH10972.1 methylated-DNA--[protein]-cysteine S-methyltransferase [Xanthomonas translucens pv. graminis]WIH17305.1 methylated-DNA--
MTEQRLYYDAFATPIGELNVAVGADGVRHILFAENRYDARGRADWIRDAAPVREAREQLLAYFAGERDRFELPLAPRGTAFQCRVWQALADIPFGATWSYAQLARHIGQPHAVRAVGAANGRNPLPIVLPCHRVIGANGALTGFGGGLPTKAALLALERRGADPAHGTPAALFD